MNLLKEKRASFFANQLSKLNGSQNGYTRLGQMAEKKQDGETDKADEAAKQSKVSGTAGVEKEVYLIKCPKCGNIPGW